MMRNSLIIVLFSLVAPALSHAEFSCMLEVTYKWSPTTTDAPPAKEVNKDNNKGEAAKEADVGKEVFWGRFEVKGETEEATKAKAKETATKERSNAMIACADAHENQTRCIAGKYAQNSASLSLMSFSQRKSFEKKILEDCEQANGRCSSAIASEPVCKEIVVAEAGKESADPKGKDAKGGKDAKKK